MSIQGAERSHIKHGDKEIYADQKLFWGCFWFPDKSSEHYYLIKAGFLFINKIWTFPIFQIEQKIWEIISIILGIKSLYVKNKTVYYTVHTVYKG